MSAVPAAALLAALALAALIAQSPWAVAAITLVLERAGSRTGCYRVFTEDDNGVRASAVGAVLHVGRSRTVQTQGSTQAAVGCVGKHRGLVVATLTGAVRSNALA